VQPKPVSFTQDAIDAGAGAAAGLVGGFLILPAEMLLRSNLLKPAELPFKVIDWQLAFKLTIQQTSTGGGLTQSSVITGNIASDPTDSFLEGVGTLQWHAFSGSCGGPWTDDGPISSPVKLRAVVKDDSSFELQSDLGLGWLTLGTFPAEGGAGSGTLSIADECGGTVATYEIQADPA
jgi:hypothetical protein